MKMPVNRMLRQSRMNFGIQGLTPPVIGGGTVAGAELDTVTAATWSDVVVVTYQWYRDGATPIVGATNEQYTVTVDDEGATLTRRDTGTAGVLSASQVSNGIAIPVVARLWTPLDLAAKLEAWWCVDDLPATAGAPLWPLTVMANGQTWVDRSSNAYVATLSINTGSAANTRLTVCDGFTAAAVAGVSHTIFTRNGFGGAPQNGGVKGGFTLPNALLVGAPAPGAFTLLRSAQNATTAEVLLWGGVFGNIGTSGNTDLYAYNGGGANGVHSDMGGAARVGFVHGSTVGTPHILGITSAIGERKMYMDGVVAYTGANTVAVAANGKRLGWSQETGSNFQFDGWFGDVVFTREVLTLLERQKLEGWYAARYELTSLLAVDHPYKVDPPMVP